MHRDVATSPHAACHPCLPHFDSRTKQGPTVSVSDITSRWTFLKGPILSAGLSEKFLTADHPKEDQNEREFKGVYRSNSGLKTSSKTREASI